MFTVTDPTLTVTVTAVDSQAVGDPLSLRCDITTENDYISNVDIVWKINGVEANRTTNIEKDIQSNASLIQYTDFYNSTKPLQLNDSNTIYQCQAVIQTYFYPSLPELIVSDNFTLIVNGKYIVSNILSRLFSYSL